MPSGKVQAAPKGEIASNNSTILSPPPNEALFFSTDPMEDASRRKAFCKLQTTVSSLGSDAQLVPDEIARAQHADAIHVKSLVFEVDHSDPILVIVPISDQVNVQKVEQWLGGNETVRLAPKHVVEQVCGFPPGSVPPLGHSPASLRTVVDEQLLEHDVLRGGGGHSAYSCLVKVETLLELERVETADIVEQGNEATNESSFVNDDTLDTDMNRIVEMPKPFFPASPPPKTIVDKCCNDETVPIPLQPTPVTIMGRLTGVRRMAKRLVFADFCPPDHPVASEDDMYPWRSGVDGDTMAVQLIAGKTLCQALGGVAGPAAIRRLKPGQLILVRGKTNVGNRDSLRNWASKRSLDIVVFSYQLIEEGEQAIISKPQIDAELRRLQLAAAVPPKQRRTEPAVEQRSNDSSYLRLEELFPSTNGVPPVQMVDSIESVNDFAGNISQLLLSLTTSAGGNHDRQDKQTIPGMQHVGLIGVDCEWKPSFLAISPNEPQPILLLQISVKPLQQVFLFDMEALFRPLRAPSETMTELEAAASETLLDLFSSQRLLKVGFQLVADLRRLASSYPHIPAFRVVHSVVEVSTFAKKAMQLLKTRSLRYHTQSLARLTEFMIGKTIDKEQQVSDWGMRPLSEEQIEYAALDAAVSPLLLAKSLEMVGAGIVFENSPIASTLQLGRWKDDVSFEGSVMSWRFLLLETNDPRAIKKLKAKRVVGEPYVVTQRWPTGRKPPMLPSVPSGSKDAPYTDASGVFRMPSSLVRITAGKDAQSIVNDIVGQRVGRSKEKCVASLLTGEAALPNEAKIEFHQRSGYVEFADGVALFVNMPDRAYKRGYPNEWLDDGKIMTWYLRENEWNSGKSTLAQKLVGLSQDVSSRTESRDGTNGDSTDPTSVSTAPPVTVLFVRMARGMFLCCGRCRATAPASHDMEPETQTGVTKQGDWGLVQLRLELLDWEKLQLSDDFVNMVHGWLSNAHEKNGSKASGSEAPVADAKEPADAQSLAVTKADSDKMHCLAEIVLTGNIVGALTVALKQARIPLDDRSIAKGIEVLRIELAKDASDESIKALKLVDDIQTDFDLP